MSRDLQESRSFARSFLFVWVLHAHRQRRKQLDDSRVQSTENAVIG